MKKAILLVSTGTTVDEARKKNILPLVERIQKEFIDWYICEGFTSSIVLRKLECRGQVYLNEKESFRALVDDGYTHVVIQPLQVIPGSEYMKMREHILEVHKQYKYVHISFGQPLLVYAGEQNNNDDYKSLLDALQRSLSISQSQEVLLIGHGGSHFANNGFSTLQLKAWQSGYTNITIATLGSYPLIDDVLLRWEKQGKSRNIIHLVPLLMVGGIHIEKDIFGDEHSIKGKLLKQGYTVIEHRESLGSRAEVHTIFVEYIRRAIRAFD